MQLSVSHLHHCFVWCAVSASGEEPHEKSAAAKGEFPALSPWVVCCLSPICCNCERCSHRRSRRLGLSANAPVPQSSVQKCEHCTCQWVLLAVMSTVLSRAGRPLPSNQCCALLRPYEALWDA